MSDDRSPISILLSTCNREPRRREGVVSVSARTYQTFALITLDAGSTHGGRRHRANSAPASVVRA